MSRTEALSAHPFISPGNHTGGTPAVETTTLYDVMAALQTVVGPEGDDIIVAVVAEWLQSGRLRFIQNGTIAA